MHLNAVAALEAHLLLRQRIVKHPVSNARRRRRLHPPAQRGGGRHRHRCRVLDGSRRGVGESLARVRRERKPPERAGLRQDPLRGWNLPRHVACSRSTHGCRLWRATEAAAHVEEMTVLAQTKGFLINGNSLIVKRRQARCPPKDEGRLVRGAGSGADSARNAGGDG